MAVAKKSRMVLYQFHIEPDQLAKLRSYARDRRVSTSRVIRVALLSYLSGKSITDGIQETMFSCSSPASLGGYSNELRSNLLAS